MVRYLRRDFGAAAAVAAAAAAAAAAAETCDSSATGNCFGLFECFFKFFTFLAFLTLSWPKMKNLAKIVIFSKLFWPSKEVKARIRTEGRTVFQSSSKGLKL